GRRELPRPVSYRHGDQRRLLARALERPSRTSPPSIVSAWRSTTASRASTREAVANFPAQYRIGMEINDCFSREHSRGRRELPRPVSYRHGDQRLLLARAL